MNIPNANSLVPGTSNNFVPEEVLVICSVFSEQENLLVKLQAVNTILMAIEVDWSSLASLPSLVELLLDPVNLLPVVGRSN